MITQRTSTRPHSPNHVGLPPPLALDLTDMDRTVGWVQGDAIGFRGFADAMEAAQAAWVAHRELSRQLARRGGRRPIPVDAERLSLGRDGDAEVVLASGRPIATLRRPAADGAADGAARDDTFGFVILVPGPADEVTMRSLAYVVYRTVRKSGVAWAMWPRGARRAASEQAAPERVAHDADAPAAARATDPERARRGPAPVLARGTALLVLVALLAIAFLALPAVATPVAIAALGALTVAGIVARGAGRARRDTSATEGLHV